MAIGSEQRHREALEAATEAVIRTVRSYSWASSHFDDLLDHTVQAYLAQEDKAPIENFDAFFTTVVRRRVIDLQRRGFHQSVDFDSIDNQPREVSGGLSNEIIRSDERRMREYMCLAAIMCIPELVDRNIILDRVLNPHLTLETLAEIYGKPGPQAMSNHLGKFFGTGKNPGALVPVMDAVGALPVKVAKAFAKVLNDYQRLDVHDDPIEQALGYLKILGALTPDLRQKSLEAAGHLRWLRLNLPNNRGLGNKVLRRLVFGACFYVLEGIDGKPDKYHPNGLSDDVQVLRSVATVVRQYGAKS